MIRWSIFPEAGFLVSLHATIANVGGDLGMSPSRYVPSQVSGSGRVAAGGLILVFGALDKASMLDDIGAENKRGYGVYALYRVCTVTRGKN
jgi:hypothetical protein